MKFSGVMTTCILAASAAVATPIGQQPTTTSASTPTTLPTGPVAVTELNDVHLDNSMLRDSVVDEQHISSDSEPMLLRNGPTMFADRVCVTNAGTFDIRWEATDAGAIVANQPNWYGWASTTTRCSDVSSISNGDITTRVWANGAGNKVMGQKFRYMENAGTITYRCTGNLIAGLSCNQQS